MHVQLPIQFSQAGDPVITVCEVGAFGDGTTRSFVERFEEAARHWTDGFIGACPNAREDAVLQRFFEQPQHHEEWRKLDPNDQDALASLASPLGLPTGSSIPSVVLRVLHGSELVGVERFDLYDQAWAIRTIDDRLLARTGPGPSHRRRVLWGQVVPVPVDLGCLRAINQQ